MSAVEPKTVGRGGPALLRLLLGLAIGFAGAWVTLQAIDRFGSNGDLEPTEIALGRPDFDGYCDRDDGRRLRALTTTGDAYGWQCAGPVRGLWTTEPIVVEDVCRWQHGPAATARLVDDAADGWQCVSDP